MAAFESTLKEAMRDIIFGSEDGLISNLGLVLGVAASGAANEIVLLAGVASMFAGAVSMAAGDYLSTKSQKEVIEMQVEEEEKKLSGEKAECNTIKQLYRNAKFTDKEIRHFVKHLNMNKTLSLKILAEEKLGLVPEKFESPLRGAVTMFVAYLLGSFFPILPFIFENTKLASTTSLIATALMLFAVGAVKTKITKRNWAKSGFEMLCIALAAAAAGYVIGWLFGIGFL